jgi:hypothetical protein
MSNYRSFVQDFPARCERLLRALEQTGPGSQYDVSSALRFAAASIVIPFERLRRECHPSKDASTHTGLKQAFDNILREKFLESRLGPEKPAHSWCSGRLSTVAGDPDAWPELRSPEPLRPGTKTRDMIFHLRNALAHGNIFTQGDPIRRIIFLSETEPGSGSFNYITASPTDFRGLLQKWFEFLSSGELPTYVIPDFPEASASPFVP